MEPITPDAHTRCYAVLGNPVRHSRSPAVLNAAFQACGINAIYTAIEQADTAAAIRAMRDLDYGGLSVTIPHKVVALAHVDRVDESARRVGCLNTILNEGGRLTGYNFDGPGALQPLDEGHPNWFSKPVLLLGAGGSARGIALAMALDRKVAHIDLAVRHPERAAALAGELKALGIACQVLSMGQVAATDLTPYGLLLNTTPVGMAPHHDASPWPRSDFGKNMVVYDIVYNPLRTRLLTLAEAAGRPTISGDGMFLGQAALQFRLWTGQEPPVAAMRAALKRSFGLLDGGPMQLKTLEDRVLIHLSGEIDHRTSANVKRDILEYLKGTKQDVYLDLREVRYIDSGAVNLIMSVHRAQTEKGLKLYIQHLAPSVERVLKLGNLDKVLNLLT